jgi:glycosyltransferase involved in cell wall biosynthesis
MQAKKGPVVAVLLNSFWVHGEGMSGGDQMAIQIFSRIHKDFSDVLWLSSPDGERAARRQIPKIKYLTTPAWFDFLPIGLSYLLRTAVVTFRLFTTRIDIIYSGSDFFPDVLPSFLHAKLRKNVRWVQCIFHIYPDWRERPGNKVVNFIAAKLQRLSLQLARHADWILNINSEVRTNLIARGFDAKKIKIFSPGIDFDPVLAAPSAICRDTYDAVFLGRLNPSKGIFDLARIWKNVGERFPLARLAVIGGGNEMICAKLAEQFEDLGIGPKIDLLGYLETDRVYSILKSAKVFIFPSYEEGFGIVIVEALAAQLPVVAWDLPVFEELFGASVIRVNKGDFKAFSVEVCRVLEEGMSSEQKKISLETAKRYSWSSVGKKIKFWLLSM